MSGDPILLGEDDVFAWDGEAIEREAVPLAYTIRTDWAAAADEYERVLLSTRSPGYAGMVSSRATGLLVFEMLENTDMPVWVAQAVADRIRLFAEEAKRRLQVHVAAANGGVDPSEA